MVKGILTVQSLSCNEISLIAQLLERSFEYYIDRFSSAFFTDYLKLLGTLIGLGFTAALVDRDLLSVYQCYLSRFLEPSQGNFKENPELMNSVFLTVREDRTR